jgi:phenylalanyl-tRNA synthetase beta chain
VKVPVSWLRDYVAIDMPLEELAERLAVSTAEVENILRRGVPDTDGNLGLYRVGKVVEAGKHPNADRLQLCRVDVGEDEPRQIVCGAWNFGAGASVAVALPGAVLPDGTRLERAKLRGAVSEGMILSERELELGQDHAGILVLPGDWEPGTPLADALPLADDVLEIESTGNRPDLLSIYGIAREIAALYDLELAPIPAVDPDRVEDEPVDVRIEDYEGCPVYIGRLFRDVPIAPSPAWLKARLTAAGMRPISNVVDVTNYVMLALGNPLHAFDHAKLAEARIVVRRARPGERLRTLDGVERELDPRDLLIADAARAIAIAGIMGGEDSEVTETTTDVLLEAANFEPTGILRSSERLRLRTEGSNRWEKGVDPYLAPYAARLATRMIVELSAARWVGEADARGELPPQPRIAYRPERASALIGMSVHEVRQRSLLERLGCAVEPDDVEWIVTVPTWRARDVMREVDLVEEIARFELDAVPFTYPERSAMFGRLTDLQRLRRLVEEVLVGAGFSEVYTPSLTAAEHAPDGVVLPEPISAELGSLRTSLVPSLVEAAQTNVAAGNEAVALFEIARAYLRRNGLPDERVRVAAIVEGGLGPAKRAAELLAGALKIDPRFAQAQRPLFHPGKTAAMTGGHVGELDPRVLEGRWGALELDLDELVAAVPSRITYVDVVTYPSVRQDLAFVLPEEVPAADVVAAMRTAGEPELHDVRVFDEYRSPELGAGKKSLAFAVTFQSPARTLTDEDAAAVRERIARALGERFGAVLRA